MAGDIAHLVLGIGGMIPGYGILFDAIDAALYIAEGDYVNAALTFAPEIFGAVKIAGAGIIGLQMAKNVSRADKISEIGTVNIPVKTKPRSVFQSNRYIYPTQDSIPYFGLRFFDFFVSFLVTVIHFSSLPEQAYNQIIQSSFYDTVCWQYARSP